MNRKLAIIIGLEALLIVMLFWVLVFYGKDEYEAFNQNANEEIEAPNRLSNKLGITTITIDTATQLQSEIKSTALKASNHEASISSYGNVVAIDSLIELRARYFAAIADGEVLKTSLAHNKSEFLRLQVLNQDDKNVSDKVLATALADTKTDEAKLHAAESNAKNIAYSMQQAWGASLTKMATDKDMGALLHNLATNKEALIQVTLPFNAPEPSAGKLVMIGIPETQYSGSAIYISPAPMSNTTIQGKTYFYHHNANVLRAGMKVTVLNTSSSMNTYGVIIPAEAVVWYGGKPWVYHKTSSTQFKRLPINTDTEVEHGWFYQGNLKANDQVVTSGAQLLLSEEFKSQITNENED